MFLEKLKAEVGVRTVPGLLRHLGNPERMIGLPFLVKWHPTKPYRHVCLLAEGCGLCVLEGLRSLRILNWSKC